MPDAAPPADPLRYQDATLDRPHEGARSMPKAAGVAQSRPRFFVLKTAFHEIECEAANRLVSAGSPVAAVLDRIAARETVDAGA